MIDYGKKDRERLLKNQDNEELAENLAGWLFCVVLVFLAVHVIITMWDRL